MTHSDLPSPTTDASDEIDLLDLLLVLADNLKLLIITPIVTALIGLGIAYSLPQTFESSSVFASNSRYLQLPPEVLASYLRAPDVRLQAAHTLGIEPELSKTRLLKKMDTLISINIGRQDKLLTVTTYGETPEAAQKLNQLLWEYALPYTKPRGVEAQQLNAQLEDEKARFASSTALEKRTAATLQQGSPSENEVLLYGELLKTNSQRLETINTLEAQLEGLSTANFTQPPSLTEDPIKPKKSLIAIAAGIAGGFLAILYVFIRAGLRSAGKNPEQAEKIRRIRTALGLKA